jgi:hypothetical protein
MELFTIALMAGILLEGCGKWSQLDTSVLQHLSEMVVEILRKPQPE